MYWVYPTGGWVAPLKISPPPPPHLGGSPPGEILARPHTLGAFQQKNSRPKNYKNGRKMPFFFKVLRSRAKTYIFCVFLGCFWHVWDPILDAFL